MRTKRQLLINYHKAIGLLVFLAAAIHSYAQVNYSYDDNGNRVHTANSHKPIKKKDDSAMVKVYPNPTDGQVNVIIPALKNCE